MRLALSLACFFALTSGDPAATASLRAAGVELDVVSSGRPVLSLSGASLGLYVEAIGRDTRARVARGDLRRAAGRVEQDLGDGAIEWWERAASGVEHGLTLEERPEGDGPLSIALAVAGGTALGEGDLALRDGTGRVVGHYRGLSVLDADGRALIASMVGEGGRVTVHVADEGARYPIVVDPLVIADEGLVVPPGPEELDAFGAVARAGAAWVVGMQGHSTPTAVHSGAAFVLATDGSVDAVLVPSAPVAEERCAHQVIGSRDGSHVALLCPSRVVVFGRTAGEWIEEASIPSPGIGLGLVLGAALSDDGGRLAISDYTARTAHTYARSGSTWTMDGSVMITGASAARTVALSGDGQRLVVSNDANNTVDVYLWSGGTWVRERGLSPVRNGCPAGPTCFYALAVDTTGEWVAIGSQRALDLYHRTGTTWVLEFRDMNPAFSVALTGDAGVVAWGSSLAQVRSASRADTFWTTGTPISGSGAAAFGDSVALDEAGTALAVGAPRDVVGSVASGRMYTYSGSPTAGWTLSRRLRGPGLEVGDAFANAIATTNDGSLLLVGAPGFDPPLADVMDATGLVYVFAHAGSTSTVEAEIEAPSTWRSPFGFLIDVDAAGERAAFLTAYEPSVGRLAIFARTGSAWSLEAGFSFPSTGLGVADVSITDDGARVVAVFEGNQIRILSRSGTTWTAEPSITDATVAFGPAGISGDGTRIFATAQENSTGARALRVFAASPGGWVEDVRISRAVAGFASEVDMDRTGTRMVVGSGFHFEGNPAGSVAIYVRSGTAWSQEVALPTPGAADWSYGISPSMDAGGSRLAFGWPGHDAGGTDAGSVFVYSRSGTTWRAESGGPFRAASTVAGDFFGWPTTLSGDGAHLYVGNLFGGLPYAPSSGTFPSTVAPGSLVAFSLASELGDACSSDGACSSGFCVDGFCCDSACGGGVADDCEACSASLTGGTNGTCGALAPALALTVVCNASRGGCDPEETCRPGSRTCPADTGLSPVGTVCRSAAGACDAAETCTGVDVDCPIDGFAAGGMVCRGAAGPCDLAEVCTGGSTACPPDGFVASDTVCRAAVDACDAIEVCDGSSAACPGDGYQPAGTNCGGGLPGSCAGPGVCTGTSAFCPGPGVLDAGTVCLAAAGACDVDDVCDGTSPLCPPVFVAAGTPCTGTSSGGVCDASDSCSGASAECQDAFLSGVECRASGGACDPAEVCLGSSGSCPPDAVAPASTVCRASSDLTCDPLEACDGASTACPADENTCTPPGDGGVRDAGVPGADAGTPPMPIAGGCVCHASSPGSSPGSVLALFVLMAVRAGSRRPRRADPRGAARR